MSESDLSPNRFGSAFKAFMDTVLAAATPPSSPLLEHVETHLGTDPTCQPVIAEEFDSYEHPNVQVALDAYLADAGRQADLMGIAADNKCFTFSIRRGQNERRCPYDGSRIDHSDQATRTGRTSAGSSWRVWSSTREMLVPDDSRDGNVPDRPTILPARGHGGRAILLGLLLALAGLVPAAVSPRPASPHLYVLAAAPSPDGHFVTGRVSVVDPTSGQELQSFPAGTEGDVDVVPSPDGARLYVAGDDVLTAFDRRSERQLWRTEIHNRVKYHDDTQSTLVASPDGRSLYLYSLAVVPHTKSLPPNVSWWLQLIDAATGQILPETIPLPDCGSATFQLVPGANTLIASCFELDDLRFIDLSAQRVEQTISVLGPASLAGSAVSPDVRWLYAVSEMRQVSVVDVAQRSISYQITLDPRDERKDLGFVALTADGTRLVVGENVESVPGTDTATELQAYDTRTWQQVAQVHVSRPFFYALAPAPAGHVIYAWGGLALTPPWTPGSIVDAIDLDRQVARPFRQRSNEDILRVVSGP